MGYKRVVVKDETAQRIAELAKERGMTIVNFMSSIVADVESDGEETDVPDVPSDEALIDEVQVVKDSKWRTAINIDAKTEAVLNWLYALRGTTKAVTVWDCVVAAYVLQQTGKLQVGVNRGEKMLKL